VCTTSADDVPHATPSCSEGPLWRPDDSLLSICACIAGHTSQSTRTSVLKNAGKHIDHRGTACSMDMSAMIQVYVPNTLAHTTDAW